jgi:dynein assembly factor 5
MQAEPTPAAADSLQQYQRDINCLSDADRTTRKRALTKLTAAVQPLNQDTLSALWERSLRAPLLKLLVDPVEKNRELTIALTGIVLKALPMEQFMSSLAHVLPSVVGRVGPTAAEPAEELRLQLLELLMHICRRSGAPLAAYLPELVSALAAGFADPFPDAKKESCAICVEVCESLPGHIEPHVAGLARALGPALAHQHSRVRSAATEAIVSLLLREPSVLPEMGTALALIATDRASTVREQAVHSITRLLATMPQRKAYAARLLPHLLCALSDEVEPIRLLACASLAKLGDMAATASPPHEAAPLSPDLAAAAAAASIQDLQPGESHARGDEAAAMAGAAAAAAAAGGATPPAELAGTVFASTPPVGAAMVVACELHRLLPPAMKELSDWTAKARTRAADALLGALWYAGPAATEHMPALLTAFAKTIEDSDEVVARQVRRCACVAGRSCDLGVYMPLVMEHLKMAPIAAAPVSTAGGGADFLRGGGHQRRVPAEVTVVEGGEPDAGTIGRRAVWLTLLGALSAGATPEQLRPHLKALLTAVASPTFCVPERASDDERGDAYSAAQLRLCTFLTHLVTSAGPQCATGECGLLFYSALMRVASVPSSARRGFESQKRAIAAVSVMAAVAGESTAALHASFMPPLLMQITAGGAYKGWRVDSADWCVRGHGHTNTIRCARVLQPAQTPGGAPEGALVQPALVLPGPRVHNRPYPGREFTLGLLWDAGPTNRRCRLILLSYWPSRSPPLDLPLRRHLMQALCRQSEASTSAGVLLFILPPLAAMLDPKADLTLRLTALSLFDHLLSSSDFCAAPEWGEMAEHAFAAMLLPNVVWRAGKPAEHVRLAAYLCLEKLLATGHVTAEQLGRRTAEALPLFVSGLDDDNVDTRRRVCNVLASVIPRLGGQRIDHDQMRLLYPELTKRLDDASDAVRVAACVPIIAMLRAVRYSASWSQAHNFDRTNLGYFLQGLLVHLDDPNPEIQAEVQAVLEVAAPLDPPEFCNQVRLVRDRHRSPRLCDALLEKAGAHPPGGMLV